MRKSIARVFIAALASAGIPPALAVTYLVGPARVHRQLLEVAGRLNPGDVVELDGNATYAGVRFTRDGSAREPIVIRGTAGGAGRPIIDAGGGADALRMDASHYRVEDLVISNAAARCVFLHGTDLTLRRVVVHTCREQGILGADTDNGDITLAEVEVHGVGNAANPSSYHHPIYIATDHARYPRAVLRIEGSWIHDNFSGNSIKSRARNLKVFYNWIETANGQFSAIEAIGPDPNGAPPGGLCPLPNGSNDALLCNAEIMGNVLIAGGRNANMMRLGGDGTGNSHGRYRLVNNTFVANGAFNGSDALIRAHGSLQSIELHNNIFWIQKGDSTALRIVRDNEATWVNGRRVSGRRNMVTGSARAYRSGGFAQAIEGLTGTIFVSASAPIFVNVDLGSPATLDLRLDTKSPARSAGNAGRTTTLGYEIANSTNLPALQPPMMRPSPGSLAPTERPKAFDDRGAAAISLGAYEYVGK